MEPLLQREIGNHRIPLFVVRMGHARRLDPLQIGIGGARLSTLARGGHRRHIRDRRRGGTPSVLRLLAFGGAPDSARSAGSVSNGPPPGPIAPNASFSSLIRSSTAIRFSRAASVAASAASRSSATSLSSWALARFAPPELPRRRPRGGCATRRARAPGQRLADPVSARSRPACCLALASSPCTLARSAPTLAFSCSARCRLARSSLRRASASVTRLVGGRDALFAGLDLLAQARCFGGRLLGGPLQLLDPFPEAGLRRARFRLHLIARRARLGQAGIELGVLPAHRHQFLVHLPRLGRGLLDRLGQLGHPRLGRLLCCCQLAPFGPRRLDLGPQLLILRLQRGELLLQLTGRGDRLRGPGQLLETPPGGRQRLLQLDERVGLARVGGRRTGVPAGCAA